MKSEKAGFNTLKFKAAAAGALIPLALFTANQLFLQLLKPSAEPLEIRIAFAVQPSVYLLYGAAAVVIAIVIIRKLNTLTLYLKKAEGFDKARRASLSIPWILVIVNTGLWIGACNSVLCHPELRDRRRDTVFLEPVHEQRFGMRKRGSGRDGNKQDPDPAQSAAEHDRYPQRGVRRVYTDKNSAYILLGVRLYSPGADIRRKVFHRFNSRKPAAARHQPSRR